MQAVHAVRASSSLVQREECHHLAHIETNNRLQAELNWTLGLGSWAEFGEIKLKKIPLSEFRCQNETPDPGGTVMMVWMWISGHVTGDLLVCEGSTDIKMGRNDATFWYILYNDYNDDFWNDMLFFLAGPRLVVLCMNYKSSFWTKWVSVADWPVCSLDFFLL